jgi:ADP-heptose:LPS heptosyltransferase
VVGGGKRDFTAKWWAPERYQEVVDHFKDEILFVQCGEASHHHPPLKGVLNLVGKTDLRQMVRLMYHADGVLCPVTMHMHLAAAVETKSGRPKNRPCVVVAGGREPSHWEAYPHHQYLHTLGMLPCCDNGGCWKSRVVPLGDGDEKDKSLCLRPRPQAGGGVLPQCLDMITAKDVIRAIENYRQYEGAI